MPKYKLRIRTSWRSSRSRQTIADAVFIWEDKADALACKELLEKATLPERRGINTEIIFVEFHKEKVLEG